VPADRRGEGMGILSFFGMMGMGLGNYIGGEIALKYHINTLFYSSAIVALLSVIVLIGLKETVPNKQKFSLSLLKIKMEDIYEPTVIMPSIVMLLVTFSFGTALTLAPDLSKFHGVDNKGVFFTYFVAASLVSRILGGKLSDVFGRKIIVQIAMLIVGVGCLIIGLSGSPYEFFVGGLVFGAGYGMSSPALFAWAADLSPEKNRGRGFSTLFMALEVGIGLGALLAGQLYGGNSNNFIFSFGAAGLLAFGAFIYLVIKPN